MDDEMTITCNYCGGSCYTVGSTVYCEDCGVFYDLDGDDLDMLDNDDWGDRFADWSSD